MICTTYLLTCDSPQVALLSYPHPFPIVVKVENEWEAQEILKLEKFFDSAQGLPSPSPHVVLAIATRLLVDSEVKMCLPHHTRVYAVVYGLHTGITFDWCVSNATST